MLSRVRQHARLLHPPNEKRDLTTPTDDAAPLDKRAAEVLARVAHEIRQPLSAALAALHVFRSSGSESVRQRASAVVDDQFRRMSRLVDDLMESTRLRICRPSLHVKQLDFRRVVQQVLDAIEPQARKKRQHLTVDVPSDPVCVDGDSVRLQQVVSNVVLNGVKHTGNEGILKLTLTRSSGHAVLTVSDTGRGIDPLLLPRIFEPFTTGGADPAGSLGIGLSVARELVELHHGTIKATSAGKGRGSEFKIALPLASSSRAQDRHAPHPQSSRSQRG